MAAARFPRRGGWALTLVKALTEPPPSSLLANAQETGMNWRLMAGTLAIAAAAAGGTAWAQPAVQPARSPAQENLEARVTRLEAIVADQARRLQEQSRRLGDVAAPVLEEADLGVFRAAGSTAGAEPPAALAAGLQVVPATPGPPTRREPATVGEAPPERPPVQVAAVPEQSGVLTPRGRFILEPTVDYVHASTNRLVFRGVEIVTGIQIGVIEASDADRNAVGLALGGRYGVTDRFEIQANVPYVRRSDRVTTLAQRDESITRTIDLDGGGLGDIEVGARYQINRVKAGRPIFIASLRIKSDTGSSPFEIDRDAFGVATTLATGSGFWGVETGVSLLYATDPVAIFAGLSYLYHMPKHVDREVGDVLIGRVDPGDSMGFSAGFGFAVNPRFSFSLGYRHNYIFPTKSELGGASQKSESLQVGSFTFGWSLRLTERLTINNSYEFGATSDAPDARVVVRVPYRF
jgi:hypothetical protein